MKKAFITLAVLLTLAVAAPVLAADTMTPAATTNGTGMGETPSASAVIKKQQAVVNKKAPAMTKQEKANKDAMLKKQEAQKRTMEKQAMAAKKQEKAKSNTAVKAPKQTVEPIAKKKPVVIRKKTMISIEKKESLKQDGKTPVEIR
ncbi:MAG TPA: hypothetical protein VLK22_01790 [Candidatus Udaeobacter sp.]|nr:hypothetical protein [Candidatus Udaeobacter sp.]